MKWTVAFFVALATGRVAAAQCPPCAESWQTPDANCYCALYECKAGNPRCDVDVDGLAALPCDQTITTSTAPSNDWSAIDWSNRVICIEAGDHTGRGTLTPTASGTAGVRSVLRYYRAGDTDDDPWHQSVASQAVIARIHLNGQKYWLMHRLTLDNNYHAGATLWFDTGAADNIANRLLVQHAADDLVYFVGTSGPADAPSGNTMQNSVLRDSQVSNTLENDCITSSWSTNSHVVSNEIYRCNKEVFSQQDQDSDGMIVENNDLYDDASRYTDCSGNIQPNGPCGISEAIVSLKDGSSTSGNPMIFMYNRMWGGRHVDSSIAQASDAMCMSVSAGGSYGVQPPDGAGTSHLLVENNVCFDSVGGIDNYWNGPEYNTFAGNMMYRIRPSIENTIGVGGLSFWRMQRAEYYLNTIVRCDHWLWLASSTAADIDLRCNVAIDSGEKSGGDGDGFEYGYNAYYGTPDSGEGHKVGDLALNLRVGAHAYDVGDVIRTSSNPESDCASVGDQACLLYRVTSAGTSAASAPAYCTTLGCTTQDGTVTVQAIRGPYCFYRKLRTNPEQVCIPYAVPHESAPEYGFCRAENMGGVPLGSRTGIGINDEVAPW
ncbi:MAG: hypothetical protein AAB426_01765 [Myxococcota bacterium]